jgi:hypothetical protein
VTSNNDPHALGKLISCLSVLESKTSILYETLGDRIEIPFVKSLMQILAQDSQKHSTILKGIGESLSKGNVKLKDCEKNTGVSWATIENLRKEISVKERLSDSDLLGLSEKLAVLESVLGEEYYVFVQLKTLELLVKEIKKSYGVDLGSLKTVFSGIINDEERHRELIEKTRGILEGRRKKPVASPFVQYKDPDAWIRPTN